MSFDIHSISVGETWRCMGMVARADGSAIVSGTCNYYLKCLTGTNAGKWWDDAHEEWYIHEIGKAMTHQGDGGWSVTLTLSPFVADILYYEYGKESGDLHVAGEGRLLRGQAVVSVVDGLLLVVNAAPTSGNA